MSPARSQPTPVTDVSATGIGLVRRIGSCSRVGPASDVRKGGTVRVNRWSPESRLIGAALAVFWTAIGLQTVEVGVLPRDLGSRMLHCHIQEHAESGIMTLVDVVAPPPEP